MASIFPQNERGFNVIKTYINTRRRGIDLLLIFISLLGFGFMQVFVSLTGKRIDIIEQIFRDLQNLREEGWGKIAPHFSVYKDQALLICD
ncbi:hypothetical protein FYJ74_06545 [Pyramidobacter sp. SM-530-WT-4B]|uniref:Uncharacterized protein n=1 Tax=Pyramidobacter porci TaxID=2605789 RepID=A0A6L5YBU4_9BACT|nr:hypothetical protein [Pyramidobacter porci]MST55691.1 hypothetical protein [Pyramidobacter porci]